MAPSTPSKEGNKEAKKKRAVRSIWHSRGGGKENAFVDHISHKSSFKVRLLSPCGIRPSIGDLSASTSDLWAPSARPWPPTLPIPRPYPQHLTASPLWAGVRKEAGRDKWCNLLHPSPASPSQQHSGLPVTETPVSTLLCCFHRKNRKKTFSCTGHFQNLAN